MPRTKDQRQVVRHAVQLPLLYRLPGAGDHPGGAGWTRDLSTGGLGVELPARLRRGTALTLRLKTALGPVRAAGQVRWAGLPTLATGGTSHGIAFTELHPTHEALLEGLLHALSLAPHAASRLHLALPVHCQAKAPAGPPLAGQTLNVGREGLAVQLPSALAVRAEVALTFPTTHPWLSVEAVIAWVEAEGGRRPPGPITHGLQFTGLDWTLAQTLGALLMEIR